MLEARETSKPEEFENSGGGTGPGSKTRHQPDITKYKYSTIRNHGRRFDKTSHQQLKNMTDTTIQNVDNTYFNDLIKHHNNRQWKNETGTTIHTVHSTKS